MALGSHQKEKRDTQDQVLLLHAAQGDPAPAP